ncbi:hypothetical protein ACRAWF_45115 [Streptomyces sp. L7]
MIWTRNRKARTSSRRSAPGWRSAASSGCGSPDPALTASVGAHRFTGAQRQLPPGQRMFDFVGYDTLWRT